MKAATIKTVVLLSLIAAGWAWVQNEDYKHAITPAVKRSSLDQAGSLTTRVKKCHPLDSKRRPLIGTLTMTADWQAPQVRCIYSRKALA